MRVYRKCPLYLSHKITFFDLVELAMLDFVILAMDWLHARYASIKLSTHVVKFSLQMCLSKSGKGKILCLGQYISCLHDRKMISKGCIYYLVRVMDVDSKIPTYELSPMVNEFP